MISWFDYITFIIVLVFSALIGIYFGCFGSKQTSAEDYLMGKRKMRIIPVGISSAVSQFSAITLIGVPADVYRYGASYWLTCFSMVLFVLINNYIYMPVFYKIQTTSVYEYLEKRFDRRVKLFVVFLFVIITTLILPLVVYAPSLAFSAVTGVNLHLVSFIVSATCVFYTAVGGLKAVVWTDVLQFVSIIVSLLSVFIISVKSMGGFQSFWNEAVKGQRLDIFDFSMNPTKRESFWMFAIGYTVQMVGQASIHQNGVQKFLALPSLRASRWSAICFAITMSIVATFCVFIGLGIYGRYAYCDPVLSKKITRYDQLVPFFLMDVAKDIPGISGLFLAALLSAALSTMSSNLNALAAVIYTDILKKYLVCNPTDKQISNILKIIVVISGVICTILVLFIDRIPEGIFALTVTLSSTAIGPILGAFTLGLLCPKVNANGGLYGMITGFILTTCITVPNKFYQVQGMIKHPTRLLITRGCNDTVTILNDNTTNWHNNTVADLNEAPFIFRISFYYYTILGTALTVVFGLVISQVTSKNNPSVNIELISPVRSLLRRKEERLDSLNTSSNEAARLSCSD